MKKLTLLAIIVLVVLVSCTPNKSRSTEPEKFVSNIPEVFWGNWVVDKKEFVNTMHFDIEKEHIWSWVENFEDDEPNDVTNTGMDKEYITETSFDPSIYNPPFGDIGYKQDFFLYYDYRSSASSLMLCYDSKTDRIKYRSWYSNRYDVVTEYTYYLERAPKSGE